MWKIYQALQIYNDHYAFFTYVELSLYLISRIKPSILPIQNQIVGYERKVESTEYDIQK